jgi:hypothetical protein
MFRVYFGTGKLPGWLAGVPALRAACFNRRTCLRWLWDNRLDLVLLVLFAIVVNSLFDQ